MTYSNVGDMARYFSSSRVNSEIRMRLDTLSQELATGMKVDPARELSSEASRVPDVQRRIQLLDRQTGLARQLSDRLDAMQAGLEGIAGLGSRLLANLASLAQSAGNDWREEARQIGEAAIEDVVSMLNRPFAGANLFSGSAEDRPALAEAGTILAEVRIAIAGAGSANDVIDMIDTWFDDVGGGFETIAYLGDTGVMPERRIDDLTIVRMKARGDDPAVRQLLKGMTLAVMADDQSVVLSDAERDLVVARANEELFGAATGLAELQGSLGGTEERLEDARVRLVSERSALDLMRNSLLSADPFETAAMLEQAQLQLETHYTLTARLSTLTLTRYL